MISILPLQKIMSSNDKVSQLEAKLQKARAEKAAWKAVEEWQIAAEKVVAVSFIAVILGSIHSQS